MMAIGDGPIKTFPLRGIKDTPPTCTTSVESFILGLSCSSTDVLGGKTTSASRSPPRPRCGWEFPERCGISSSSIDHRFRSRMASSIAWAAATMRRASEPPHERDEVPLLLVGELEPEDEVEELDRVLERQQPAVVQVRRANP